MERKANLISHYIVFQVFLLLANLQSNFHQHEYNLSGPCYSWDETVYNMMDRFDTKLIKALDANFNVNQYKFIPTRLQHRPLLYQK